MDTVKDQLKNNGSNSGGGQGGQGSGSSGGNSAGKTLTKYRNEIREYNISGPIESTDVNSITFLNRGTNTATINSFILQTGESVAFEGLAGEIDATIYSVAFGSAGTNSLIVFAKKY
jgi:hypothetical protein